MKLKILKKLSVVLLALLSLGMAQQGKLVIAQAQDPGSWDPIDTFYLSWGMVASNIFDGLVDRGVDLKIRPGLAERWEWLDGNKVLRFYLRKGVKFHDGEPFNAEAVKFTFDRLLGPEGAKGPQQANYNAIKEVKIVDEYTVDFIMARPDPVIITKLAGYGAMIVPPKYIKEKGDAYFNTHPVGTGPFRAVEYVKDDHLTLEAFPDYWGGAPKVKTVVYRFIPEAATRVAELQAGRVDIAQGVPISLASVINGDPNLKLMPVGSPTVTSLRFNVCKKPTDDVRVRKAIVYAVDREAIIESILQGYGKPIAGFQSELSFGYDPTLKPYPYDPQKARELLREAGVKPGTEIELNFIGTDATFREVAQAVAGYLQAVGFKVRLKPYEVNTYYGEIVPKNKVGHLYYSGWGGWTLDYDNTAYLLYHTGQFWNPCFSDKKVDQWLEEERSTYDQTKREKILQQIDRYLHHDQVVAMPMYQVINLWGVSKRVKNFTPPPDDRIRLLTVEVSVR